MVRRVMLLACAGILVFSMSACGKSQEAAKHQIEGSHVVSAESSVSAQEPEELSEAEPELPQDDEEITGAVEQIQDGTEEPQPEQNVTQPEGNQQSEQSQTVERGTVNYADRQEIYLDSSWQYADHSAWDIRRKQCKDTVSSGRFCKNYRRQHSSRSYESDRRFRRNDICGWCIREQCDVTHGTDFERQTAGSRL